MKLSHVRFIHSINYYTKGTNVQKTSLSNMDDKLELVTHHNQDYILVGKSQYVPMTNVSVFVADLTTAPDTVNPMLQIEPDALPVKNKGGRPSKNALATNGANKETFNS